MLLVIMICIQRPLICFEFTLQMLFISISNGPIGISECDIIFNNSNNNNNTDDTTTSASNKCVDSVSEFQIHCLIHRHNVPTQILITNDPIFYLMVVAHVTGIYDCYTTSIDTILSNTCCC